MTENILYVVSYAVFTPDNVVLSICIHLYRLSPSKCILYRWQNCRLRGLTATCIHLYPDTLQVARPGYMYLYPATCIWCKRGFINRLLVSKSKRDTWMPYLLRRFHQASMKSNVLYSIYCYRRLSYKWYLYFTTAQVLTHYVCSTVSLTRRLDLLEIHA